ncbi:adenylate cyclase NDAI_0H03310 [Naumovozyma dairenensis CBS 421]|uniref:Adenylate cyclase n=1 Tax=Naumovozyma dairenensis (strain ATCC 10597 / BCRC 20456 / CBS 421 / NBRC 0211 / NRRL Y-12639) TaxID=1071378 RepID=G0WFE3_NAUDC|nr:hypothetical protein NDAI_0H03310 [Naumovozyma dairenensis CBS 421]CCD26504.1 hypothetical protein NDAI_0H03310 [Naumovozyma dairenensis CBS 421]
MPASFRSSKEPSGGSSSTSPHDQKLQHVHILPQGTFIKKINEEAPTFRKEYTQNLNDTTNDSPSDTRRNSTHSLFNPLSISKTMSRDSIASNSQYDIPESIRTTVPTKSKSRKGGHLLQRTLSSLSITGINPSSTQSIPNEGPNYTTAAAQVVPPRKHSFAGGFFKRLSGAGNRGNQKNKEELQQQVPQQQVQQQPIFNARHRQSVSGAVPSALSPIHSNPTLHNEPINLRPPQGTIDTTLDLEDEDKKNTEENEEIPALFPLDTNLENLDEITKAVAPIKSIKDVEKITSSPIQPPKGIENSVIVVDANDEQVPIVSQDNQQGISNGSRPSSVGPKKSHSMADIPLWASSSMLDISGRTTDASQQQWTAPESWDVDSTQKKSKIKSKSRARRAMNQQRNHTNNNNNVLGGTSPNALQRSTTETLGLLNDGAPGSRGSNISERSMVRLRHSLAMSKSNTPILTNKEQSTASVDSNTYSSGKSISSTDSSGYSSSDNDFFDETSIAPISDKPKKGSHRTNENDMMSNFQFRARMDKNGRPATPTNDPFTLLTDTREGSTATTITNNDDEHDKLEFELEKYYKDVSDLNPDKHYAIRIFNTDDTFATLSYPPGTTVQDMIPALKRKFNITSQGSFQISLKVGKLSKILRPTAKPILVERRLVLLSGYMKSDSQDIMGIEDLSFVFKFIFHPVTPSYFTSEQEQQLMKGDFVHVDLRNMDLTTPPIIFYQHTSEIESLDVSNNANIFLPLEFIESAIKLSSLRMVNIRASKFPNNITEAYKLVTLELQRNFIKRVPKSISKLTNLTILNLQCNELERLSSGFANLKNLQLLDLSSNKFTQYPEVINSCKNLLQIDLSYNKIQNLPQSINNLVKLAKINLSHNKLEAINDLSGMTNLRTLNLRYNRVASIKSSAANLQNLFLTDNRISTFEDSLPKLRALELQENPITSILFKSSTLSDAQLPTHLTSLSLSKAKLSHLPGNVFKNLSKLEKLELSENNLSRLPVEIASLSKLVYLSAARNKLEGLPSEFSNLKNLRSLDIHTNNIREFFDGMENIELTFLNISSNAFGSLESEDTFCQNMKADSKLAKSLMFFVAADNHFDDSLIFFFNCFKNLKLLNLSYNNFSDISFLSLEHLTEFYFSGNKLNTLDGDTVVKWKYMKTLMLNRNQLLSLPTELSQLSQLAILDVGSNQLKYNISNYHYDWNWSQNKELKYLNFSGNRRFEIRSFTSHEINADLSDLTILPNLKVLGLMDVTLNTNKVPDENTNFRLRTTASTINGMGYGVADSLGQRNYVCSRDVTFERFRGKQDECLLCLHDSKNQNADYGHNISMIVRDIYDNILVKQLEKYGDSSDDKIKRALRFSFLELNRQINRMLNSVDNGTSVGNLTSADLLSGVCSTVIYIKGKKLYTANIGDCRAMLCKNNGEYEMLTTEHIPSKREEYERIRISGGYVNNGKLDGVVEVSRAVGFFDLLPHIHAAPDISVTSFTGVDETVVIATNKLWEYMDVKTVSDISRENANDPLLAAETMKDYVNAYGYSDNITIMCLALFKRTEDQSRVTLNRNTLRRATVEDATLRRLAPEIPPPTGNLALVFTDIQSSSTLWELYYAAMSTALSIHNDLMRRQLRIYGGYEIKTEGDAFVMAFPTPTSALLWCLSTQLKLLDVAWPEEITSSPNGRLVVDSQGKRIFNGLCVRMGIHWGSPLTVFDLVTQRMDYLGPVVNKASRVSDVGKGGQITLSSDFCSEFKKILALHERAKKECEPLSAIYGDELIGEVLEKELSALEGIGWVFYGDGEHQLKGLESKEFITLVYPKSLESRHQFFQEAEDSTVANKELLLRLNTVYAKLGRIFAFTACTATGDDIWKVIGTKELSSISNLTSIQEKDILPLLVKTIYGIDATTGSIMLYAHKLHGIDATNTADNNFSYSQLIADLLKDDDDIHDSFDNNK